MKQSYVFLFLLVISSCQKSEKQLVKITAKNIAIDNTTTMFFILFTTDFVIQQIYQLYYFKSNLLTELLQFH